MAEPTSTNMPSAIDTTSTLSNDLKNLLSWTLSGSLTDVATTITATSNITGITAPFYIRIDNELIWVTGISSSQFTGCTRGCDGTTAVTHADAATIYHVLNANIINQHRRAIIATETAVLGIASQFWLSGAGGWPSTTSGCADPAKTEMSTNKQNVKTLDFDQSTQEYAEWTFGMPSDYAGGTVTAKFFWTANSTSTNSAIWGLQARCYADDEALDQSWGTAQEVTDANKSTAYDLNITASTSAITIGGTPAAGELVQWRAYRKAADGSDDLAVDAKLLGIQITYSRV